MAQRLFEEQDHAEVYAETRPSYPAELINYIVNEVKNSSGSLHLALDAGCGSGQNTELLSKYFNQVIGIDVSEAQIKEGIKRKTAKNITYLFCPAESFPVEDESLDLVTCAASFHWFDKVKFFGEVHRTLRPGGCLAIYCYEPQMSFKHQEFNEIFKEEIWSKITPYAHPCVSHLLKYYHKDLEVPFLNAKWRDDFFVTEEHPLAFIFELVKSFAFYRAFYNANQHENVFAVTEDRCRKALSFTGPMENFFVRYKRQFFIHLSQKGKTDVVGLT